MAPLSAFKGVLMGLTLLVSYSNMVLDIIMIIKVHENLNARTYPPAVVAMLVLAIVQLLYCVYYFIRGGKSVVFKAVHVLAAFAFFFCYNFGAIVAVSVLRHHDRYCPATASNVGDCRGVMRGTMGLGWALIGFDLIYVGFLAALVSSSGKWQDELTNIPPKLAPNADLEKAPAH